MARAAAEDEFHDFVQARWSSLVRYAYLLTGDPMPAEDVVQVALERSWRRWRQVAADRPESYVRTAIARTAVSRHRARRRRVTESPLDLAVQPVPLTGDEGPEQAESRAARELLWTELSALPPRMRAVVVLRIWEDLSEADTARVLGCSPGSVKSQLSRGMARLRESAALRQLAGPRAALTEGTR